MKAILYNRYGGAEVLEYTTDAQRPEPGAKEVLIKVYAAGINPVDWKIRSGQLKMVTGKNFPKIPGQEVAGEVVKTGEDVPAFRHGDEVYAMLDMKAGGYAEYVVVNEQFVCTKPKNLSFEQAASVPLAALTALQALRDKGGIRPGMKVLINGASGGVGTFAIQIAKAFGARVTAVCSTANVDMVRKLGADEVIDYTRRNFVAEDQRYDIILEGVGNRSFGECKAVMSSKSVFVSLLPSPGIFIQQFFSVFSSKKAKVLMAKSNRLDLEWVRTQIEQGKIKPFIDRAYPMIQAAEAHRYSESGRVKGKLILSIVR